MTRTGNCVFLILFCWTCLAANAEDPLKQLQDITYLSKADNTQQPAMFFKPASDAKAPLVVALHSWSGNYKQTTHNGIAKFCIEQGWVYIHPNFRGPSNKPSATGSELVIQDILSAVDFARQKCHINDQEIYLVGASGGGYHALLMAGRAPQIWTGGVSAWVPITDLTAWYHETKKANRKYYKDIMNSCGGVPGQNAKVDEQYRMRSPLTYLAKAKPVRVHIHAGITDGHTGSVPVSHSLHAFNILAKSEDQLPQEEIQFFVKHAKVPPQLRQKISDSSYGKKQPLFRRSSGKATITIFDGGHELIADAAIDWIRQLHQSKQQKK